MATSGSIGPRACSCSTAGRRRYRARTGSTSASWRRCGRAPSPSPSACSSRAWPGRRAGAAAALLSGLLSTSPVIEGFSANGELMATLPALIALALTARWQARGGLRLMVVAGLFAGAAVLVKQSGYDGGLAAGLWLLLAAWRGWRPGRRGAARARGARARRRADRRRRRAARGADRVPRLVVRGRRLPPLGRERRDRLGLRSGSRCSPTRCARRPGRGRAGRARAAGLWLALRRPETTLLALWLALSLTGFALGGLFHGHYYVGPLTPLCALAALALAAVPPRLGLALGLAALILPVYKAWPAYTADGTRERSLASSSDSRIVTDGAVGRYLHAHTGPGDRVYALYADASLYLAAGRRSPYPYLWFLGIEHIPGALQRLRDTLAGPGCAALHRRLPAAAHDRQARRHRPHPHAALPPRGDDRGRPDLAPTQPCLMPCTGRPCACQANSVIVGRSSS